MHGSGAFSKMFGTAGYVREDLTILESADMDGELCGDFRVLRMKVMFISTIWRMSSTVGKSFLLKSFPLLERGDRSPKMSSLHSDFHMYAAKAPSAKQPFIRVGESDLLLNHYSTFLRSFYNTLDVVLIVGRRQMMVSSQTATQGFGMFCWRSCRIQPVLSYNREEVVVSGAEHFEESI